jgi:hypothetical protein
MHAYTLTNKELVVVVAQALPLKCYVNNTKTKITTVMGILNKFKG